MSKADDFIDSAADFIEEATNKKPDTTLRDEIEELLPHEKNECDYLLFGGDIPCDCYCKNATQSILDAVAKRLPEYRDQTGKTPPDPEIQDIYDTGFNQALSEVRAIIEGENGKSL